MEAKQKAIELVNKYLLEVRGADRYNYNLESMNFFIAKECSLIAVGELINDTNASSPFEVERLIYWNEVKNQIQSLTNEELTLKD